jgi:HEAT repeat protein
MKSKYLMSLVFSLSLLLFFALDSYIEAPCPGGGGGPPPSNPGGAPGVIKPPIGGGRPAIPSAPTLPRPQFVPGLMPLLQTTSSFESVVEPWEVWWSRNRDKYLSFREQIEWVKVTDTGGTKSVNFNPAYEQLVKILADGVSDSNSYVAFRAAIALGKAQDAQNPKVSNSTAIETLQKAFGTEKRFFVENNIILGLGLTTDPISATTILDILKNKKEAALRRSYAALALGYINSPDVLAALKNILTDKDEIEVKSSVCLALGNLKDTSAVPLLGKILNTPEGTKKEDPTVRSFAALGLGRIGNDEALKELKNPSLAAERVPNIRLAVVIALGLINSPDARTALLPFLQDKIGIVRGYTAISLSNFKDDKTFDLIFEAEQKKQTNESDGLMVIALGLTGNPKAKPELHRILENPKARSLLKAAAAISAGLLKNAEVVPIIINFLKDERQATDVLLTPYLILSLGLIQDSKAVEPLKKMWIASPKNPSQTSYTNLAVALSMLGSRKEVIAQLIDNANSKDIVSLPPYALHTLGLVGDGESAKLFVEAGKSTNLDARKAVMEGIGFLLDKNPINPIDQVTGNSIDITMVIMEHILPIPVW